MASATLSFGHRQWRRFAVSMVTILASMIMVPAPAWADSIRQQQWFLDTLNIPAAQQISTGAGVTVAVIDSGVDTTHPDLQGQLVPGKCIAEFLDPRWDLEGHGTAMAGLIAAKGDGDGHALGVAPGAKVLPICIDGSHIDAYVALREIAQGIHYAVDHGATVINISVGFPAISDGTNALEEPRAAEAVGYALVHNVVIIAGAGNVANGVTSVAAPAGVPGVVAVAGTVRDGTFWSGSAQGPQVAVAAPATEIVSTDSRQKTEKLNTGDYASTNGTSNAAAIVSGVVALIRSKYPTLNAANVINRLIATATHEGSSGRNSQYGYGLVNPVQALTASVPTVTANPLGTPPPIAPAASRGTAATAKAHNADSGNSAITLIWVLVGMGLMVALVVITLLARRRRGRRQRGQEWAGSYPTDRQGSQLQESQQSPASGPGPAGHS